MPNLTGIRLTERDHFRLGVCVYCYQAFKVHRTELATASIVFVAYARCAELCVVQNLKVYIDRTKPLRAAHTQLLTSSQKPYLPVPTDTIARWLKTVPRAAGISDDFSAHSTRAASASAAKRKGSPLAAMEWFQKGC